MAEEPKLNHPWLVAVWPGMGNVALNAGVYLLSKLGMNVMAEYAAGELFDVDHVEVKEGLLRLGRRPRNLFFAWKDPGQQHDLLVFLGEAQPPLGKRAFCQHIVDYVRPLGVEHVFTFAAMATQMHPQHSSRVFGAATDAQSLDRLKHIGLEILEDGHIGGLNGVLLGVAAESGLQGTCLLGEMPHVLSQLPFPKASLAILEVFTGMARIDLDVLELAEQARIVDEQLGELLGRVEEAYGQEHPVEEEAHSSEFAEEQQVESSEKKRIEQLFEQAAQDRSRAFELKQELDRLGLFKEYEDRFLDLFKSESS